MKNIIKKIFLSVGALCLAIGSVFGINAIIKANKEESPLIVGGIEENGIRLKHNKIVASGTHTNILASISAVVGPDYAYDKTVSWSVAWASTDSNNINDYVSLSISDDTLTCDITVKQAFTTKINLNCVSNSNNNVKANCTLDYVGRTVAFNGSIYVDGDPHNRVILDLLNSLSINYFYTTGGTLSGSISHFDYVGMVLFFEDGKVVEITDLTDTVGEVIEDILDKYDYTLEEVINVLETNTKFIGNCHVNYDGVMIMDGGFTLLMPFIQIKTEYFVPDSVSLSDSQLIF